MRSIEKIAKAFEIRHTCRQIIRHWCLTRRRLTLTELLEASLIFTGDFSKAARCCFAISRFRGPGKFLRAYSFVAWQRLERKRSK